MKKGWKITSIVVASLLALISIFLLVYYCWPWNKNFFDHATQEFEIPGLDTEFVPQGFTKVDNQNYYLISGYMNSKESKPSRFYLIDSESNEVIKYFILDINGKKYDGHAGGVASHENNFWTVSDGLCLRFTWNDVSKVNNGEIVYVKDYFEPFCEASFVTVEKSTKTLWIGEFYRDDNYLTDVSHHFTTRSGETNHALVLGYEIDSTEDYGISSTIPKKALSIPDLCQGMEIDSTGKIVLSTSYSIADSNLYYYTNVMSETAHDTFKLGFYQIPLWFLDNESLISKTTIPSMSEEIVINNNRVYVLFESASKKYKLFNRKQLKNVYSVSLSYLEK